MTSRGYVGLTIEGESERRRLRGSWPESSSTGGSSEDGGVDIVRAAPLEREPVGALEPR